MSMQNIQTEFAEAIILDDPNTAIVHPRENIRIYRNNMIANLMRALHDTYPLILKLVGNEFFRVTANEYIKCYPARSSNLHDYGEYFSDFLGEYPPSKNLMYLPEVAQFEWACHQIFFAADPLPFNLKLLESIAPEQYDQLHFILHPACQLCQFRYPLLRIVDLCKGHIDETINIYEGGVNLLIIRRDLDICLVSLTKGEFSFLSALSENKTVSESLQAALTIDAHFQLDEKLSLWIKDKTIVECYL